MADFGQEDEVVSKSSAAPAVAKSSWGADDEVVNKFPTKPTSQFHAGYRAAGESVAPGLGGLTGAVAGATAIAPYAATAAAASGPFAPVVGASLELLGAGAGAFVGAETVGWMQNKLHQLFAPEDYEARKEERKQYPITTTVGNIAGGVVGLSPKVAIDPAAKFITTAMRARGASAAGQAGVSAGTQLATTGKVDLGETMLAAGTGFVLPGVNIVGSPFVRLGERIAGKKSTQPISKDDLPQPPPPGSTPEQIAAHLEIVKAEKAKRDFESPIFETAIKNTATGEVERYGPKNSEQRKADVKDNPDYVEGFVTERGQFLTRQEAVDQAKRAGQLPEDYVLENPLGEEPGLHSGDLRKAGDERFTITEDQPAGTPKPFVETPVTRLEHKNAIDNRKERLFLGIEIDRAEAALDGDAEGLRILDEEKVRLTSEIEQLQNSMPTVQFENPVKPTWEELHDHLWGSRTVGEAFDRVLKTKGLGSIGQRLLIKSLTKSDFIRSANLKFSTDYLKYIDNKGVEKQDAAGLYTGGDQHLLQMGKDGDIRVLAHEAMHAGTQRLLLEGGSTAAIRMQELFDKYKLEQNKKYDEALQKELQEKGSLSPKEYNALDEKFKHYGFENVHEFVAEAFTNKEFQKLLSNIKVGKQPKNILNNLWGQFKETVRLGLGIPEGARTALDEVFDHGISMVEQSKSFTPRTDFVPNISSPALKVFEKIDPRSIANEEEMVKHSTDIYERYGEEATIKFFEDYQKNLNERSIPVPNNGQQLDDAMHKVNTFETKDKSEHVIGYKESTAEGITAEQRKEAFDAIERGETVGGRLGEILRTIYDENLALIRKIKSLGKDVGEEFTTGQSRIRMFSEQEKPGWKDTLKNFFSSNTPLGDKIGEQAKASLERTVYQTSDGRVIELVRHPEDVTVPIKDRDGKVIGTREVKRGTEVYEWLNGKKQLISYSPDINLKRGDKIQIRKPSEKLSTGPAEGVGSEKRTWREDPSIIDGNVLDIEKHSPYRYWHDAEASARIANMALRKTARELELVNNLKKSKLFEQVGFSPDKPLKDLPKGWVVPSNLDRIPELRGWHFDPKTAAIIEDFAKVWDNTMWMKATNAIVKNMMLNPVPHMFNEVMHLWNARGFTGWVDPRQMGTFATTARLAWKDVGNQTKFYRDIMRDGGSILGADPRNNYFDALQKEASKQIFGTPEMQRSMGQLAIKLGTSVGDLYNGISNASQKAMWFTRDVMYVQYIREIMSNHESRTGTKMELKDAIEHAERHMPNYRMPSEVLGSRTVSQILKNPNVSLFSRYHYGMVKSLVNTIKDIDPRNLKTPEGRANFREGVDSMLAIGAASAMLYPLMDYIAKAMFGESAEQRRAGPFHLLHAAEQVVAGKKDLSALLWPVFTFNPMLLMMLELPWAHKLSTGKPIYHPQDSLKDIASDIGTYLTKQVPQASAVMSATADEGGETQMLARQLDIKVKTPAQIEREKNAAKREITAKKGRDTKRKEGIYRP
jgi:hypothetical protein